MEGNSSKEVACQLDLSLKTAETHRASIMRKLGLRSFSELVLYAVRNNIIQVTAGADLTADAAAHPAALATQRPEAVTSHKAQAGPLHRPASEIQPTVPR